MKDDASSKALATMQSSDKETVVEKSSKEEAAKDQVVPEPKLPAPVTATAAPEPTDDAAVLSLPEEEQEDTVKPLPKTRKPSVDDQSLEDHFASFDSSTAQADQHQVGGGAIRAAATDPTIGPAVVTPERKEALLLKAREDRLEWIQQVPLPFRRKIVEAGDPWSRNETLLTYRSSHAGSHLPAAFSVLSHLYGTSMQGGGTLPSGVVEKVERIMKSDCDDKKAFPSGKQTLNEELSVSNGGDPQLAAYHQFWSRLQEPEAATLVTGMRNFCRNLVNLDDAASVATKLKAYLESTRENLKVHALWKKQGVDESVRRSLESFVYGHCHAHLQSVLVTEKAARKEQAWMERVESLQFVTPLHLEIACLEVADVDLEEVLKGPMDALRSIDSYYSAFEKLQRILAMYHGVNAALSEALNRNRGDASKKLPSADDVLPAIILTVLRAMPTNLHVDLQMVEDYCPPEYLRGEAGYAYTNLYGAVHFLLDMDLSQEPKSLSMSPEEFRKGLEACKAATAERLGKLNSATEADSETIQEEESTAFRMIPPQEIRAARRRGEAISLDWAIQWQKENTNADLDGLPGCKEDDRGDEVAEELPPGFSRNYSFLACRPEDIKMSDLPQLLSEYRMLVHTTETLIGQRTAKASAERKQKTLAAQKELLAVVKEVDPTLLPTSMRRSKPF